MIGLVPGSVESWLEGDYNGFKINPPITNQLDLHPASCTHHSFVSVIESAHKILWDKRKDRAKRDLQIDIRWLLAEFPPPTNMHDLIKALKNSKSNGTVRATNGSFPFRVVHSECLPVGFGEADALENYEIVEKHIRENGPVLGSFYPSPCYKPGRQTVYVSDQQRQTIQCPECKRPVVLKHAVCVVGTARASVNGVYQPCFVYIESDKPKENSKKQDGVCCMTADSMYSITLPFIR